MYQMQHSRSAAQPAVSGQFSVPQTDWSREISPAPAREAAVPEQPAMTGDGAGRPMTGLRPAQDAAVLPGRMEFRNGLPVESITAPVSTEEVYRGSMKAMLAKYVGTYIVASFLVGTQSTVDWEGVLFDVGNDYLTIYQPGRDRYIVGDIYSLKFVEFYDTQRREMCDALLEENGYPPRAQG